MNWIVTRQYKRRVKPCQQRCKDKKKEITGNKFHVEQTDAIGGRVPTIHFGTGTATMFQELREAGGDVIGVDWRIPIDEAWEDIGFDRAVQGNLDPTLLLGPPRRMLDQAEDVLNRAGGRPGHIFNLGHGILPSTPVENVQMLAQYVHRASRQMR